MQLEFGTKVARMGSWREAAFRFERAIAAEESNARAWNNLGVARENLGELDGAKEAYERAMALAPDERRIRLNYDRFLENYRNRPAPRDPAADADDGPEPAPASPENR